MMDTKRMLFRALLRQYSRFCLRSNSGCYCKRLYSIMCTNASMLLKRNSSSYRQRWLVPPVSNISNTYCTQSLDSFDNSEHLDMEHSIKQFVDEISEFINVGNRFITSSDWRDFRANISRNYPDRASTLGGVLMKMCVTARCYLIGKSYMQFLSEMKLTPNLSVSAHYVALCGDCADESSEEEILSYYDTLRSRYPVLDSTTCGLLIQSVCKTQRWKECLQLMDMMKLTTSVTAKAYNAVIETAFLNNEFELGWDLMKKAVMDERELHGEVYKIWIQHCVHASQDKDNMSTSREMMQRLLQFLQANRLFLPGVVMPDVRNWFQSCSQENWVGKLAYMSKRGECSACHDYLDPMNLTREEFQIMRQHFLEQVIEGSDVFLSSDPVEVKQFQNFIKKTAPYDVVIDGLNVSHTAGRADKKGSNLGLSLLQVVKYLTVTRGKKVLVLGRKHMLRWPPKFLTPVRNMADCFFAENLSNDDRFLLYATMYSGLGTVFVSGDMMRDHLFKLGEKFEVLFRKWQLSHQMLVLYITADGLVKFKAPMKFDTIVHCKENVIHIPYDSGKPRCSYEVPDTWLCLTKS